jgi:hypothetical protein
MSCLSLTFSNTYAKAPDPAHSLRKVAACTRLGFLSEVSGRGASTSGRPCAGMITA